jgi:solute carrier family 39 (zinc transporter), member 7
MVSNAMLAALTSTALISVAPNVLLVLFPQYASGEGLQASALLSFGQAIAAGGLLGDVFLHTIPHAAGHDVETMGIYILVGFSIFFVIDILIRSMGGDSSHDHHRHHQRQEQVQEHNSKSNQVTATNKSAVILNLLGDSLHNFTDGVAIGVSFASSAAVNNHNETSMNVMQLVGSRGGIATLSILMHEVPHELGDFAVLVKNGLSKKQAILAQFGTAIAAMIGTITGLQLHEFAGDELIYMTSGGFLYLATCTIMPEILEEASSIRFRFMQLLCFASGISLMYVVTLLEAADGGLGHSHSHHHHHNHHHDDHHIKNHDDHDHDYDHTHHHHDHHTGEF